MIRAIIFDCFGVLATDKWLPFKKQYLGETEARIQQADDLLRQANTGFIGHEEFVAAMAQLTGAEPAEIIEALSGNAANQSLFEYIAELKQEYKIGFLSNASANWMPKLFTPEQIALFDAVVMSNECGMAKPDPAIYRLAAERLGVEPAECVFIDDLEWYVTAAEDTGMSGIQYQQVDQVKADLKKLLAKKA